MLKYLLLILILNPCIALSQDLFKLKTNREIAILGAGTLGMGATYLLQRNHKPFTESEVNALSTKNLPRFDRFSLNYFSSKAKKTSDWILISSLVLPTVLMIDPKIRKDVKTIGVIGLETLWCNAALVGLTKELVRRPRPFTHNPNAPLSLKMTNDARQSFFSGHSSLTAAATFATASIWSRYHPDSKWKPYIWGAAAVIPASVAYLRVRAGKHYLSDVVTGVAIGAISGWLIPKWHRSN